MDQSTRPIRQGRRRCRAVVIGAIVALTGVVGAGSEVAAAAAVTPEPVASCPVSYQPAGFTMRVASVRTGWKAFGWKVHQDDDGYYHMAIAYNSADGQRNRVARGLFDRRGNEIAFDWIIGGRSNATQRLVGMSYDDRSRLTLTWAGDKLSTVRFRRDGSRDESFGWNGQLSILPTNVGDFDGPVWVAPSERGHVIVAGNAGQNYLIDHIDGEIHGPYRSEAANALAEHRVRAITSSRWGNIIFATESAVFRETFDGRPTTWWGSAGVYEITDGRVVSQRPVFNDGNGELTFIVDTGNGLRADSLAKGGNRVSKSVEVDRVLRGVIETEEGQLIGMQLDRSVFAVESGLQILSPAGEVASLQILPNQQFARALLTAIGSKEEALAVEVVFTAPWVTKTGGSVLSDWVRRSYLAYTSRQPTVDELEYWRRYIAQGGTIDDVSAHLGGSAEFERQYGALGHSAFVNQWYVDLLGRQPSGYEHDEMLDAIDMFGRVAASTELVNSLDYAAATGTAARYPTVAEGQVRRLYRAYFRRGADHAGVCYWANIMRSHHDLRAVSNVFAASDEFRDTYGKLDNQEFVSLVYRNVMRRQPDQAGWQYWVHLLEQGVTRGEVMLAFSESQEFILRTDIAP